MINKTWIKERKKDISILGFSQNPKCSVSSKPTSASSRLFALFCLIYLFIQILLHEQKDACRKY